MASHIASVSWKHDGGDFPKGHYSRVHTWTFDGGVTVPASASPHVVRAPWSDASAVDPEEAFVAALSSCHLLTFLFVAGKQGYVVASYDDHAVGTMTKNEHGVSWISEVVLTPRIAWSGDARPSPEQLQHLHAEAHHQCFIANSVKTQVSVVAADP